MCLNVGHVIRFIVNTCLLILLTYMEYLGLLNYELV